MNRRNYILWQPVLLANEYTEALEGDCKGAFLERRNGLGPLAN